MQITGHINEDLVMAMYLGNLAAEDQQRLQRHASECPICKRELTTYREVLSGLEALAL
ncbi:zf-HC2 domain-containing protein, partial [candidate division KSB1 bacterium]|nr:zf-HC2 domain-containing protein [candidate division KSB1 bacterium]